MKTMLEARTDFEIVCYSNYEARRQPMKFEKGELYSVDGMGHFGGHTLVSLSGPSWSRSFRKIDLEENGDFITYKCK